MTSPVPQTPEPTDEQRAVAMKLVLGWGMDDGFPALVDRVARALAAAVQQERDKVHAQYETACVEIEQVAKQSLTELDEPKDDEQERQAIATAGLCSGILGTVVRIREVSR